MKFFLVTLALAVVCTGQQFPFFEELPKLSGDWNLIYMASDNTQKTNINGPFDAYLRSMDFDFSKDKPAIHFKFYIKKNGECTPKTATVVRQRGSVFLGLHEGVNYFEIVSVTKDVIISKWTNVDDDGVVSKFTAINGRKNTVSAADFEKFKDETRTEGIPEENIVAVATKDDCPLGIPELSD